MGYFFPYLGPAEGEPMRERDGKIKEMHEEGMSLRNIGLELGISHERVRQVLERLGSGRPPGRLPGHVQNRTIQRIEQLTRWRDMDITTYEAAWLLDVEPMTLKKFVHRHGLGLRLGNARLLENADRLRKLQGVWNDELRQRERERDGE